MAHLNPRNDDNGYSINPNGGKSYGTSPNRDNYNVSIYTMNYRNVLKTFRRFKDDSGFVACMVCHRIYADLENFFYHYPEYHDHNLLVNTICRFIINKETPIQCLLCGRLYQDMMKFLRHAKNKHILYSSNIVGLVVHHCKICGKGDSNIYEMLLHIGCHVEAEMVNQRITPQIIHQLEFHSSDMLLRDKVD